MWLGLSTGSALLQGNVMKRCTRCALEKSISDALGVKVGDTIQLHRQDQKKTTKLAILDGGPQRHGDPPPDYSRGKDPRRRAVAVASQEGEVSTEDSDEKLR